MNPFVSLGQAFDGAVLRLLTVLSGLMELVDFVGIEGEVEFDGVHGRSRGLINIKNGLMPCIEPVLQGPVAKAGMRKAGSFQRDTPLDDEHNDDRN